MGTRSKGRGIWVSSWEKERHCDSGAFGQSRHQKILNYNNRVIAARAEQEKGNTTKPKG